MDVVAAVVVAAVVVEAAVVLAAVDLVVGLVAEEDIVPAVEERAVAEDTAQPEVEQAVLLKTARQAAGLAAARDEVQAAEVQGVQGASPELVGPADRPLDDPGRADSVRELAALREHLVLVGLVQLDWEVVEQAVARQEQQVLGVEQVSVPPGLAAIASQLPAPDNSTDFLACPPTMVYTILVQPVSVEAIVVSVATPGLAAVDRVPVLAVLVWARMQESVAADPASVSVESVGQVLAWVLMQVSVAADLASVPVALVGQVLVLAALAWALISVSAADGRVSVSAALA